MERKTSATSGPKPATTGRPPSAPATIWIVVRSNGERHFVSKEPLEGIHAWARGQNVTVIQYDFATMLYEMKPEEEPTK